MEKAVLIFPGQGSQYVGMGKKLCEESDDARELFAQANDILHIDISKLCFEGPSHELSKITNSLPAIYLYSVALYRLLKKQTGLVPVMAAGHSLGEYSALTCSGALDFAQTLRIIRLRSEYAMAYADRGMMAVVYDIESEQVSRVCGQLDSPDRPVTVGCYNSPEQCIISGDKDAVKEAMERLRECGAIATPILFSPPFHCRLMEPVSMQLSEHLEQLPVRAFAWPVLANWTGRPYELCRGVAQYLTRQMYSPVLWEQSLRAMWDAGVDLFIEVGPQSVLAELTKQAFPDAHVLSYSQSRDREELLRLTKTPNKPLHRPYRINLLTRCLAAAVSVRNNNPDVGAYEVLVVEPYRAIKLIQQSVAEQDRAPTVDEETQAMELLRRLLEGKRVPRDKIERITARVRGKFQDNRLQTDGVSNLNQEE